MISNSDEKYTPFDLAVKLKKLGFDGGTIFFYNQFDGDNDKTLTYIDNYSISGINFTDYNKWGKYVSRPTLSQAQTWFRNEKNIHINPKLTENGYYDTVVINYPVDIKSNVVYDTYYHSNYEDALENSLHGVCDYLLNIKNKENDACKPTDDDIIEDINEILKIFHSKLYGFELIDEDILPDNKLEEDYGYDVLDILELIIEIEIHFNLKPIDEFDFTEKGIIVQDIYNIIINELKKEQ